MFLDLYLGHVHVFFCYVLYECDTIIIDHSEVDKLFQVIWKHNLEHWEEKF